MEAFKLSIEPVILLYSIITNINYNAIPQLLLQKVCLRENAFNETFCQNESNISVDIHEQASKWWFYLLLSFQIPSILTTFISGAITDAMGRRKCLLLFPLVDALGSLSFLVNAYFSDAHPAYFIPGYLLISLFGELQGVFYLCYAFVADSTKNKEEKRTPGMVFVDSSSQMSTIFGGLLVGYVLNAFGYVYVFIINIGLDFLIILYVSCYLSKYEKKVPSTEESPLIDNDVYEIPDDITKKNNDAVSGHTDVEHKKLFDMSTHLRQIKDLVKAMKGSYLVPVMMVANFFVFLGFLGEYQLQVLYLKAKPFNFNHVTIGYYITVSGVSRAIGSVAIILFSFHCYSLNDYILMIIGALSQILSYVLIGISRSTVAVFLSVAASFAMTICASAIRSVVTKNLHCNQHGTIIALSCSINIIAALLTNIVSTAVFRATLSSFTGTVYFGLAGFSGVALMIIITSYIFERKNVNRN